jgi:anti-anti-sigma factor
MNPKPDPVYVAGVGGSGVKENTCRALPSPSHRSLRKPVLTRRASLGPGADGMRHVVLDLRGLTFMDASGLRELTRQNEYAHQNRHNLAVVRGRKAIQRRLELTAVEEILVMVDEPQDLAPPSSAPAS